MQVALIQLTNPQFWGILVLDGKSKTKPVLKKFILQKLKTSTIYKHFKYQL